MDGVYCPWCNAFLGKTVPADPRCFRCGKLMGGTIENMEKQRDEIEDEEAEPQYNGKVSEAVSYIKWGLERGFLSPDSEVLERDACLFEQPRRFGSFTVNTLLADLQRLKQDEDYGLGTADGFTDPVIRLDVLPKRGLSKLFSDKPPETVTLSTARPRTNILLLTKDEMLGKQG